MYLYLGRRVGRATEAMNGSGLDGGQGHRAPDGSDMARSCADGVQGDAGVRLCVLCMHVQQQYVSTRVGQRARGVCEARLFAGGSGAACFLCLGRWR
jgi:hypothetical protein